MKKITALIPDYYNDFSCIAEKCLFNCCQNWGIPINKTAYKKYRSCRNSTISSNLSDNFIINKNSKSNKNYAFIKLDQNGSCPFLCEGRCRIQADLGEEYLSDICDKFPRMTNVYTDLNLDIYYEQGMLNSCEQVINLLDKHAKISFENVEVNYSPNLWFSRTILPDDIKNRIEFKYYKSLKRICLNIMETQNADLDTKISFLGFLLKTFEPFAKADKSEKIIELFGYVPAVISNKTALARFAPSNSDISIKLGMALYYIYYFKDLNTKRVFTDGYIRKALSLSDVSSVEDLFKIEFDSLSEKYEKLCAKHSDFLKQNELWAENIMTNYMHTTMFPISDENTAWSVYLMFCFVSKLVKLTILSYKECCTDFSHEQLCSEISQIFRTISVNDITANTVLVQITNDPKLNAWIKNLE